MENNHSLEVTRTGPSWEQRKELGFFKAMFKTIQEVLLDPSNTFLNMKREGGLLSPFLYSFILGTISVLLGTISGGGLNILISGTTEGIEGLVTALVGFIVSMMLWLVLAPVIVIIGMFITAGITHLCLMIVGGANRDFETTYRTCCYCGGSTSILGILPLCGGLIAFIWQIVALIIGLSKTHETSTGKAVAAVLIPFAVCCAGILALGLLGFFAALLPELQR